MTPQEYLWSRTYSQAIDEYRRAKDYTSIEIAELGKIDRFFLLTVILGRNDANHPWIYDRCREVERNPDGYLDLWAREHYKALSFDTPVFTPDGWKKHGALKVGDKVYGPEGDTRTIVAVTPLFNDADCYKVTFDGAAPIICSGDHLWSVMQKSRIRVDGNKRLGRKKVTLNTREMAALGHGEGDRLAIPVAQPFDAPDAELPVDPYVLGAWLGDGNSNAARITAHVDDVDHMVKRLEQAGHVVTVSNKQGNSLLLSIDGCDTGKTCIRGHDREKVGVYRHSCMECRRQQQRWKKSGIAMDPIIASGMAWSLRKLGVYADAYGVKQGYRKYIPDIYLRASPRQRWELLRGLMDTDGHVSTRGTALFCNTNKELADSAFQLIASLGLKPKFATRNATLNRRIVGEVYHIQFQAGTDPLPFSLPRKAGRCNQRTSRADSHFIRSVDRVETVPVSCIRVDAEDGLYVVGRDFVTTHNSTVITFAGSIQEILNDPEITIGIFSFNKPVARKFLRQIKYELESNETLKSLYPDILWADPKKESPRWSEDAGIVVRRNTNPKEATIEANGLVDGQPTGAHYRLRLYDDVVTVDSVTSPEMVQKTTEAWSLSDNLGARPDDGGLSRFQMVGTRYSFGDSYNTMLEMGAVKPRIYPATHDGTRDGNPVFLPDNVWADKKNKQTSSVLAAQMLQNPAAGKNAIFDKDWLRFQDVRPATLNIYILCDPASSKKKGSDRTAIPVIGIDSAGNRWLVDGFHHRMSLSERYSAIKGLRKVWQNMPGVQMVKVGYERYGSTSDLEYFEESMRRDRDEFEIVELAWPREGPGSKIDRVQRLEPYFRAGRFFLPAVVQGETRNQAKVIAEGQAFRVFKPTQRMDEEGRMYSLNKNFLEEYLVFPFCVHDDLIDAMSRIEDIDATPPVIVDERALEPEVFEDGI